MIGLIPFQIEAVNAYMAKLGCVHLQAQVLRKLKAVPHSRGLSNDPQGEFVAAASMAGDLQVWEMLNGKQVLNRKKAGPNLGLQVLLAR